MYNQGSGEFVPMATGFQQSPQIDGEDADPEELERITKAENDKQELLRSLYHKQEEEQRLKQERKNKGRDSLNQWTKERKQTTDAKRKVSKDEQSQSQIEKKRLKETTNPWERVVSNVEINQANYVGGADVTRMRQAMIARKNDITKSSKNQKNII